jgi:nucleotidyltransferase substrate binding protein (TIGR01987 family)
MMEEKDIRWQQRFSNYKRSLRRLTKATDIAFMSDLEKAGLIHYFEMTFDLAWKTLQDLLREKERPNSNGGPNVIIKQSFEDGYIENEELWRALKKAREMTSHEYDEEIADEIVGNIIYTFHDLFIQLETRLQLEKINQNKQE